jgi:hypothetical protein
MSQGFPCPNPVCPHTFPPEAAAAGAVVCPRCGGQFCFRAPPAVPFATPVDDEVPVAEAVAVPMAAAATLPPAPRVPSTPPDPGALTPGPLVAVRPRTPRGGLRDWVVPIAAVGLFAAVLAAGAYLVGTRLQEPGGPADPDVQRVADLNYSFRRLGPPWERASALQSSLPCDVAYRRAGPPVWVAVAARDFKTRNPSDRLLLEEALTRLRRQFKNVEYQPAEGDAAKLGGLPTRRVVFQADQLDQPVAGEVLCAAHQGIGYWLFVWTETRAVEQAKPEFAGLRESFALLGDRPDWKTKVTASTLEGADGAVQLQDAEGLWEKYPTPADYGDQVVLALKVNRKVEAKVSDNSALVLVYLLNGGGVPSEAARQAVLARQKEAGYPETRLTPWDQKDAGPGAGATLAGLRVERLRVQNDKNRARFGLLAAGEKGGRAVAVFAECDPDQREFWESNFGALIETLRVGT